MEVTSPCNLKYQPQVFLTRPLGSSPIPLGTLKKYLILGEKKVLLLERVQEQANVMTQAEGSSGEEV